MKLTVSRGATINLEHYESSRIDLTVEQDIGKEVPEYALEQLDEWLKAQLERRIVAIRKEAGLLDASATKFTGGRS